MANGSLAARRPIRQTEPKRRAAKKGKPPAPARKQARKPKDPVQALVRKEVRPLFFRVIAATYWEEMCEFAGKQGLGLTVIADRLGQVGSTKSRWVRGQIDSGAEKFFATLLLVLKRPLSDVPFSGNRELVEQSVRTAVERIAAQFCSMPNRAMTQRAIFILTTIMRTTTANEFVPTAIPKSEGELRVALWELVATLKREIDKAADRQPNFRTPTAPTPTEVYGVIRDWALPFAIFCLCVLPGWGVFDG